MHQKILSWLTLLGVVSAFTLSAFAATAPAASTAAAVDTAQKPGTVKAKRVQGDVKFENIATKEIKDLTEDMSITQGTIVRTGPNSSVVLAFSNGASISLGFESELNILEFTQNPFNEAQYKPSEHTDEPSVSTTNLKLTRGELVGNVKKLKVSSGSKFTVGTPVGAAGIRGTTFRIVYRPAAIGGGFNFTITTLEGNVALEVASGTVTAPPVSVTDNKEVVIENVTVNTTTGEINVVTPSGQTVTITAAPPPTVNDAPPTSVQIVAAVAQTLAQTVANVVFTSPTGTGSGNNNSGGTNNTPEKKDDSNSPGNGTSQPNLSDKAGSGG